MHVHCSLFIHVCSFIVYVHSSAKKVMFNPAFVYPFGRLSARNLKTAVRIVTKMFPVYHCYKKELIKFWKSFASGFCSRDFEKDSLALQDGALSTLWLTSLEKKLIGCV